MLIVFTRLALHVLLEANCAEAAWIKKGNVSWFCVGVVNISLAAALQTALAILCGEK